MGGRFSLVPTLELRPRLPRERRDCRGRRIGRNWWREYNCSLLLDAALTWEAQAEAVTYGYRTEMAEYAELHPRPNLKDFLVRNKGMMTRPDHLPEYEESVA